MSKSRSLKMDVSQGQKRAAKSPKSGKPSNTQGISPNSTKMPTGATKKFGGPGQYNGAVGTRG